MRRMDMVVWAPFIHGARLGRDVEREANAFFPMGNWLNKRTGRELTMPHSAYAFAFKSSTNRIGNAGALHPFWRRRQFREMDDLVPNFRRRSVDLHSGGDFIKR